MLRTRATASAEILIFTLQTSTLLFYPNVELVSFARLIKFAIPRFLEVGCPAQLNAIGDLVARVVVPIMYVAWLWVTFGLHILLARWLQRTRPASHAGHTGAGWRPRSNSDSSAGVDERHHHVAAAGAEQGGRGLRTLFIQAAHVDHYILTSVVLGIGIYEGITEAAITFFTCTSVGQAHVVLFSPSIVCFVDELRAPCPRRR